MSFFKKCILLFLALNLFNVNISNSFELHKKKLVKTKNQVKKTKKQSKKDKIKNKQKLADNKKYPQCNEDNNCIKMQKVLHEKDYKIDKNEEDNNQYDLDQDDDIENKDLDDENNRKKFKIKKNSIISNIKHKNIVKKKKEQQSIKNNKKNIKKTQKIEYLDEKKIANLIKNQPKLIINQKPIVINTKNKGVPNMCKKKTYVNQKTNNDIKEITVYEDLGEAKQNLKEHIKLSLIANEVSNELTNYIMENLNYIQLTKQKHKSIKNRTDISTITKYNIDDRAKIGKKYKTSHYNVLQEVEDLFLVDKNVILAIWSMETNHSQFIGKNNAFNALYSACMNAGSISKLRYFENNIIALALLVDLGVFPKNVISSFDGGLGGCQFMPESVYKFAVSLKGKKTDIINSDEDVIASIGNYLHSIGWRYGEGILTEIEFPKNIDPCLIGMNTTKTVKEWKQLGIVAHKNKIGKHYMYNDLAKASIIITDPNDTFFKQEKRAFLVYDNYKVILGYNTRLGYGLTCGILFEKIGVEQMKVN